MSKKQSSLRQSEADRSLQELAGVQAQTAAAREQLAELMHDIDDVKQPDMSSQLAEVVQANEQLLISSLRAREDAERAERALEQVLRSTDSDALTQLPSRKVLLERLVHAIDHARRNGSLLALLFLDLDDFKRFNDTLGHAVGDEVLKVTARCLASALREDDMVSRHGGDEFVILLTELSDVSDAVLVADKVIALLGESHHVRGHDLSLKASIGISVFPEDGDDAETLLDRADAAMYSAKRKGLDSFIFHHEASSWDALQAASAPASVRYRRPCDALTAAEHERHHTQLREANQELVLAALGAQKLQAAAELAHQRQKDVLALVAHELRNPLTPMSMAAGMLGRARPEDLLKLKDVIEREVGHMSRLVGDLLDISRADVGKLRVECGPADMIEILDHAVHACRHVMDARRQVFSMDIAEARLEVHADATRMAQVIRNLLDNASKYTPEGGRIRLEITLAETDMVMTVADDGIGIRAEALPHVFDPYVQDLHAVSFNGVGVGIGLTVVRELVEAHGGTVAARSEGIGKGSTFVVTIPRIVEPLSE